MNRYSYKTSSNKSNMMTFSFSHARTHTEREIRVDRATELGHCCEIISVNLYATHKIYLRFVYTIFIVVHFAHVKLVTVYSRLH